MFQTATPPRRSRDGLMGMTQPAAPTSPARTSTGGASPGLFLNASPPLDAQAKVVAPSSCPTGPIPSEGVVVGFLSAGRS